MNIILMGPQGSGKGTQAKLLSQKFNFTYFEGGSFLREMAKNNESLKKIMDSGELVPDAEMCSYVTAYLDENNIYHNILFDGFPRTYFQYGVLKNWLEKRKMKIDLVLVLEISEEETINRLVKRAQIEGRRDDNLESIKKRLSLYHERTELLISQIKEEVDVIKVNGERSIEAIFEDLSGIIAKYGN